MRYAATVILVFVTCLSGCHSQSVTRHYRLIETASKTKSAKFELFLKGDKTFEVVADKQKMFEGTWTEVKDEIILSYPTKGMPNSHYHVLDDKLVRFEDGREISEDSWMIVKGS